MFIIWMFHMILVKKNYVSTVSPNYLKSMQRMEKVALNDYLQKGLNEFHTEGV